jgi:hypothetical protein
MTVPRPSQDGPDQGGSQQAGSGPSSSGQSASQRGTPAKTESGQETSGRRRGPDDPWQEPDPPLALALAQLRWYARHRNRARRSYQANEILILLTTASTTVMAALKESATATAILAASTVVLAGLYKVLDSHENWLAFGSAWAELQIAVNNYRLLPASERDEEAQRLLVEKVNEVNTAESGRWVSRRRSLAAGGK